MPEAMAGGAEDGEVLGLVGAAVSARDDVVDFEETGSTAAWGLALMAIAGEDPPAGP